MRDVASRRGAGADLGDGTSGAGGAVGTAGIFSASGARGNGGNGGNAVLIGDGGNGGVGGNRTWELGSPALVVPAGCCSAQTECDGPG